MKYIAPPIENTEKIIFVYHSPCRDGFTAAYVAYLKYPTAEFLPETPYWGTTKKLLKREDIAEYSIYYLDCCPRRKDLVELHGLAKSVIVYDHHLTAEQDCGDLPYVFIDLSKSGASLAWKMFHPDEEMPFLVQLIEDRDLWKWQIPDSKAYSAYIETQPQDFSSWGMLCNGLDQTNIRLQIKDTGQKYLDYQHHIIHRIATKHRIHWIKFKKYDNETKALAINSPILQSELGSYLNKRKQIGLVYYNAAGLGWNFSIRSRDDLPDVSKIAKAYGGGGHRNAAGFRLERLNDLTVSALTPEELQHFHIE